MHDVLHTVDVDFVSVCMYVPRSSTGAQWKYDVTDDALSAGQESRHSKSTTREQAGPCRGLAAGSWTAWRSYCLSFTASIRHDALFAWLPAAE